MKQIKWLTELIFRLQGEVVVKYKVQSVAFVRRAERPRIRLCGEVGPDGESSGFQRHFGLAPRPNCELD